MDILLYIGSVIILIWGIAHIIPTKSVVKGFGEISDDNTKIITMEWVAEGITLCFIGLLILLITAIVGSGNPVSALVYKISAGMLVVMAIWTSVTGARTSVIPIKICPIVKTAVAVLFILGSLF
ncbi:hypothetical protein ACFLTO_01290 [Chloroflexota bacterium]